MISRLVRGLAVAVAAIAFAGVAYAHDGPYVRGDLGWVFDGSFDINDNDPVVTPPIPGVITNGEIEFNGGWLASFGGGYAWPSGWRAEGEVAYRFSDLDEDEIADQGGDVTTWALMLNGYYDFNKGGTWEPYIGLGVGYASVDINANDVDPVPVGFDDDSQTWAWQGMLGVAWEVTDQMAIDFSYRYFDAPEIDFNTTAGASREGDYVEHAVLAGIRYTFGAPPPPPPPPEPPPAPYVPPPAPPPPAACPTSEFVIYFEWDRSNLNQAGQDTINQAISRAQQCNITSVDVVGHTDTSGSTEYNMGLSERRASVVRDALVAGGLNSSMIRTESRGETDLAKPTADGVREPLNRRSAVSIMFH